MPVPADLVEAPGGLASFHQKDRHRPLFGISQQWVSKSMKGRGGDRLARAHPRALRHTYGRNALLRGVPTPVLQSWLGHRSLAETERHVALAGTHHSWVERLWRSLNGRMSELCAPGADDPSWQKAARWFHDAGVRLA